MLNKLSDYIYKVFVSTFGDLNGKADKFLHSSLSCFLYVVFWGLLVVGGISTQFSLILAIPVIYGIGWYKEKHDTTFDKEDLEANVRGIMIGFALCLIFGVVIW